jgi:hypothetical protein
MKNNNFDSSKLFTSLKDKLVTELNYNNNNAQDQAQKIADIFSNAYSQDSAITVEQK